MTSLVLPRPWPSTVFLRYGSASARSWPPWAPRGRRMRRHRCQRTTRSPCTAWADRPWLSSARATQVSRSLLPPFCRFSSKPRLPAEQVTQEGGEWGSVVLEAKQLSVGKCFNCRSRVRMLLLWAWKFLSHNGCKKCSTIRQKVFPATCNVVAKIDCAVFPFTLVASRRTSLTDFPWQMATVNTHSALILLQNERKYSEWVPMHGGRWLLDVSCIYMSRGDLPGFASRPRLINNHTVGVWKFVLVLFEKKHACWAINWFGSYDESVYTLFSSLFFFSDQRL